MNRTVATTLSVIAHPVFVNLASLYLLFMLYPPLSHGMPVRIQLFFISFIFISTGLIPLIMVGAMRIMGKIKSITLEHRDERKLPYLYTLALYVFNYYNFMSSPTTHPLILRYLLACIVIVGLVLIINYYTKISIHMATLGAFCGLLAAYGFTGISEIRHWLTLAVLVSGLVASARLSLQAHLPKQIYSGYALGFVLMFLIMNLNFTIFNQ